MARATIAEVLKNHRKSMRLTATEVTARLAAYGVDLSPKSLYSYESGHRQPDADTLMALCKLYEIKDVLAAFGYKNEAPAGASINELTENEHIFMSLPPDLRQEALRYMRYLVEQKGSP